MLCARHPRCASPVVQAFAVGVNDHMPRAARQRLKPFAPRIIGTNDGLDGVRAAVLLQALDEGVLSGASGQQLTDRSAPAKGRFAKLWRLWRWLRKDERGRPLDRALSRDDGVYLAREAARLIARSARRAPDARERERHWDAAIGLLDRLCDVGAPVRRGLGIRTDRLARLGSTPRPPRTAPGREEATSALLCGTPTLAVEQREFAAEANWDPPSLEPGATPVTDTRVSGTRAGHIASVSLASSTRFTELDAFVWTADTVRVLARNASGSATGLGAATLSAAVAKRRAPWARSRHAGRSRPRRARPDRTGPATSLDSRFAGFDALEAVVLRAGMPAETRRNPDMARARSGAAP